MKFKSEYLKIDNNIYIYKNFNELWVLAVFDYPKEYLRHERQGRKCHIVWADSEDMANNSYDYYKDYKDKDVICDNTTIYLDNIATGERISKFFNSIEEREKFVKEHKTITTEDYSLIFKYRELNQRERHHQEILSSRGKLGRMLEKESRASRGLPMDIC